MNPSEAAGELRRLSDLVDASLSFLKEQVKAYGAAEEAYRLGKARAYVEAPKDTAAAKQAWVDGETAGLRKTRDIADGMRGAAMEAVRARRGQLSAMQSLLNAHRAEAEFARTSGGGP